MAVIDTLVTTPPQSVYLFPTTTGAVPPNQAEALFFQYWPQSLSDDYQVEYAEHLIPGGSHPLYQWVGGRGRVLSFQAIFTSEINTNRTLFTGSRTLAGAVGGAAGSALNNGSAASFIPSGIYTVDVAAALSKIRSWMRPRYGLGGSLGQTEPPKILTLAFPGTKLNGTSNTLTVILKSAPITYESWFPDGQPRVATVDLTFNEVVQSPSGDANSGTKIEFIDRTGFETEGDRYRFRGLPDRPFVGA